MKSRRAMRTIAITIFAVLTTSTQMAAQQPQAAVKEHRHYKVIDLGTLGGTFSQAFGINNNGTVVGFSTLTGDPNLPPLHAFLWRKGVMTDLGTLAGTATLPYSVASSINDNDEIVGFSETATPDPLGENFCGDSLVCLPVLWWDGVMTPLPTLGGTNGQAVGINNRGQVLGFAENSTPDPTCVAPEVLHFEPVIWNKGEIQQLPTFPGDPDGIAGAINDAGLATLPTGDCAFLGPPSGHDSLFKHGTLTDFGTFGGHPIAANDINNKGQVVGVTSGPGGTEIEAVLWQDGVASGLGTLPGDVVSLASAISDNGKVIGQSCDANGNCRGFLWQDSVMTDLNVLAPADAPLMADPADINSRGEIVGLAVQRNTGALLAFLAIPCDEEHPSVEGCDYAPVDAAVASQASAASAVLARVAVAQANLTPSAIKDRVRAFLTGRNHRLRGFAPK